MIDRRVFIATATVILGATLAASAEQAKAVPRLGVLFTGSSSVPPGPAHDAFNDAGASQRAGDRPEHVVHDERFRQHKSDPVPREFLRVQLITPGRH